MPVDRQGDYIGNHGGAYTDMNGMSRQFTYVDHDKKTKIATKKMTEEEWEQCKQSLGDYRFDLIKRITSISASLCPHIFSDYTIRGDVEEVGWNTDMLIDAGVPLNQLRDLCLLIEKRANIQE